MGQCILPRGWINALLSPGFRFFYVTGLGQCRVFFVAVGTISTAKGSDARPAVPWAPLLLRDKRGTMCVTKRSDVYKLTLFLTHCT